MMEAKQVGSTRAAIAPGYRWRLGVIALVCLAFGAWFFHDGFWTYPREIQDLRQYQETHGTDGAVLEGKAEQWEDYAKGHGLALTEPVRRTQSDIKVQYLLCLIVVPVGIFFAGQYGLSLRRWIAVDDAGLEANTGQKAPFDAIKGLNKERWKTKGIAVVRYARPDQSEGKLVLDDWKYDAPATRTILLAVEAHLTDAQITGGERERKPTDVGVAVPSLEEGAPGELPEPPEPPAVPADPARGPTNP
jgi:hypothetical protein